MAFFFRKKPKDDRTASTQPHSIQDYKAVAATDVGAVRANNEDNLLFTRPYDAKIRAEKGCLALVADGMGGHSSGELASKMAIDTISRTYYDTQASILESLEAAFEKANKAIFQKASRSNGLKGMGTTCTAVVLIQDRIFLAHVGDSRAYLVKGDTILQLSKDHTYVQYLLDQGKIRPEEAMSHPDRNVITQAMGTNARLQAEYKQIEQGFAENDKLIMCTDGLYEYVKPAELKNAIASLSLNDSAHTLINLAKQRGGHDNISVLIVETFRVSAETHSKETQKLLSL